MAPEAPTTAKAIKSTASKRKVTFLPPLKAHGHGSVRKPVPKKRNPLSSMSHNPRQVKEVIDLESEDDIQPQQVTVSRDTKGSFAASTHNGESSKTSSTRSEAAKQPEQPQARRIDETVPVVSLKKPAIQHLTPAERLRLASTTANPLNFANLTPPVTPTSLNPLNPLHHGHSVAPLLISRTNTPAQRSAPLPIRQTKTSAQDTGTNKPALPAPAINRARVPAPLTLAPIPTNRPPLPTAPLTADRLSEPFRYLPPPVRSASHKYQPLPSGFGSPGLARGDLPYSGDGFIDGLVKNDLRVWTLQTMETWREDEKGEGQGRVYGDMDVKKFEGVEVMEED